MSEQQKERMIEWTRLIVITVIAITFTNTNLTKLAQ
jgi:hypothetical protein